MKIYLATDHRGFKLKELIKQFLSTKPSAPGSIIDLGATSYNPEDDYVDYAKLACKSLASNDRAILFCGSGHGMDIAANRYPSVRAILGFNLDVVLQGRAHEDANILVIPADWIEFKLATKLVEAFLTTPFSSKTRHVRRLNKLQSLGTKH